MCIYINNIYIYTHIIQRERESGASTKQVLRPASVWKPVRLATSNIYIYIYIYIHIYIYIYIYVSIALSLSLYIYIYVYMCMYMCV